MQLKPQQSERPGNIIESQTKEAEYDSDWSEKRVKNQQSASVVVGCEEDKRSMKLPIANKVYKNMLMVC